MDSLISSVAGFGNPAPRASEVPVHLASKLALWGRWDHACTGGCGSLG